MTLLSSKNIADQPNKERDKFSFAFLLFNLWTFVLMCRPQDIFHFLEPLRLGLLSTALALGGALFSGALFRGPSVLAERQVKLYLALFVVMVLSIPFSLYARLSFTFVFTIYIVVALYFFLFYKLVNSLEKLVTLVFIVCLGTGLYSACSITTGNIVDGRLNFGEAFDPNDLAYLALSALPLNLFFISRDNPYWKRLACMASTAASILLILLTGSRGGLLAFVMVAMVLLFKNIRTITKPMKLVFISMTLVVLSMSNINVERYASIFNLKEDYNVQGEEGRLAIWAVGVKAMLNNPLTGVGMMCFNNAVGLERAAQRTRSQAWQTAHNSAIQIGTETGVIGLVLYLLMSFDVLRIFNKARREAVSEKLVKISEMGFAGFVGLFSSGMFLSQAYSLHWAFYVVFSAVVRQLLVRHQVMPD